MAQPLATTGGHDRINDGLLASHERRCLNWLAARMPLAVNSDHLTVLGFLGLAGCGLAFWGARLRPELLWLAVLGLVVNWFGDSLDGTLARFRNQQRPRYGFYVDHVVDVFGAACLLAGMGASGFMSPRVAAGLLLVYLMLAAELYLATHTVGTFRMTHFRLGPTELRVVLAIGIVRIIFAPTCTIAGRSWMLFDVAGAIGIVGLVVTLLASVARNTRALYRAEPLR